MASQFLKQLSSGLWHDNPGLVQLLGLCPLLAVTGTFVNGLGLGLATLAVLVASNALVSASRRWIQPEIRVPIYVLIIASLVTCIELIFKAFFPDLDRTLGIFVPLIVTNCAIVARAEVFASRNPVGASMLDGFVMGLGFALLLMIIGAFREIIGHGTLFARMANRYADWYSRTTAGCCWYCPPAHFSAWRWQSLQKTSSTSAVSNRKHRCRVVRAP